MSTRADDQHGDDEGDHADAVDGRRTMGSKAHEREVCSFVRQIIEARAGESVSISSEPDVERRNEEAVEELWDSPSLDYAVEHTQVESFEGQLANIERIKRLLSPVKDRLAGRLPGYYVLSFREEQTTAARIDFTVAHHEVEQLVLVAIGQLEVGEAVALRSERLPFQMQLRLRHKEGSAVVLRSDIEGDPVRLRVERFRRAFDDKCPKLARWSRGRTSVLVLESDDSELPDFSISFDAVREVLEGRDDQPDTIVYVETDVWPWSAWVFKDGKRVGNAAMRNRDGEYRYTFVCEVAKKALHHVQPGGARGREVDVEARVPGQPPLDLRVVVGGVVVADEMHLEVCRYLPVDEGEERDPLLVPVARHACADDVAGQRAQGREEVVVPFRL